MNSGENDGYVYLGEHIAPEARRLLDRLIEEDVRYRLAVVDNIRRAWPWGPHGNFTRIAIFVKPEDLRPAQRLQDEVVKLEL